MYGIVFVVKCKTFLMQKQNPAHINESLNTHDSHGQSRVYSPLSPKNFSLSMKIGKPFYVVFHYLLLLICSSLVYTTGSFAQVANTQKLNNHHASGVASLFFEQNIGQREQQVSFTASQGNTKFSFDATGISASFIGVDQQENATFAMKFRGARCIQPIGSDRSSVKIHDYSQGSFPNIPAFREVWYSGIYEGIDLRYYEQKDHMLEYDFILKPYADVNKIKLDLQGVTDIQITDKKELRYTVNQRDITNPKPYSYQMVDGKQVEVAVDYKIVDGGIAFDIVGDNYRSDLTLTIDPMVLNYTAELDNTDNYLFHQGKLFIYDLQTRSVKSVDRTGALVYTTMLPIGLALVDWVVHNDSVSMVLQADRTVTFDGKTLTSNEYLFIKLNATGVVSSSFVPTTLSYGASFSISQNYLYVLNLTQSKADTLPTTSGAFLSNHIAGYTTNAVPAPIYHQSHLSVYQSGTGIITGQSYVPSSSIGSLVASSDQFGYIVTNETMSFTPDAKSVIRNSIVLPSANSYFGAAPGYSYKLINGCLIAYFSFYEEDNGNGYYYGMYSVVMYDAKTLTIKVLRSSDGGAAFILQINDDGCAIVNHNLVIKPDNTTISLPGANAYYGQTASNGTSVVLVEPNPRTTEKTYNPITCIYTTTQVQKDGLRIACFDKSTGSLNNEFIWNEIPLLAARNNRVLSVAYDSSGMLNIVLTIFGSHPPLSCGLPIPATIEGFYTYYLRIDCDGKVDYLSVIDDVSQSNYTGVWTIKSNADDIWITKSPYSSAIPTSTVQTPNNLDCQQTTQSVKFLHFVKGDVAGTNTISPSNQTVCKKEQPLMINNDQCSVSVVLPFAAVSYKGASTPYSCTPLERKCNQWQKSLNGTTWTDIAGAEDSTYTPEPLSVTTYYRRMVYSVPSNVHTVNVTANTAPEIATNPLLFCPTQQVQFNPIVTGSGPFTYLWSPSMGLSSASIANPTLTPTASGSYGLLVTDANGCKTLAFQNVSELKVNAGDDKTVCNNGVSVPLKGTLSVSGGGGPFTYLWTIVSGTANSILSGANTPNPLVLPTETTIYRLTVTGPDGCIVTDDIQVKTQTPGLSGLPTQIITCSKEVLAPVQTCYQTTWSPSAGLSIVSGQLEYDGKTYGACNKTIYTITSEDRGGVCPNASGTIEIILIRGPQVTVTPSVACPSATIGTADQSCAPNQNTHLWSVVSGDMASLNGQATVAQPTIFPSETTSYSVAVTNGGTTCNFPVTVQQCVSSSGSGGGGSCPSIAPIVLSCKASYPYSFNANRLLDSTVYTLSIASADSEFNTSGFPNIAVTNPFNGTRVVTFTVKSAVTGQVLCTTTLSVTGIIPVPIVHNVYSPTINCGAPVGVAIGDAPESGFTYIWTPANGLDNTTKADAIALPEKTTTYTLKIVHIATGCEKEYITEVKRPTIELIPSPDASICATVITPLKLGLPPISGLVYSWSPASNLSSVSSAQPNFTPTGSGTFLYAINITDPTTNCVVVDSIQVTVAPAPIANAGADVAFCQLSQAKHFLGSATTAGTTYTWAPITGLSNPAISNPEVTASGQYKLFASVGTCISEDEVIVTINPVVTTAVNLPDVNACPDAATPIGKAAEPGKYYVWKAEPEIMDITIPNPSVILTKDKTFVLTEFDSVNCTQVVYTQIVKLTVSEMPSLAGPSNVNTCLGTPQVIGVMPVQGITYLWSPATNLSDPTVAQPTFTASAANTTGTTHTLTYLKNGCVFTNTTNLKTYAVPVANAGAAATACPGASTVIGAASVVGITYKWDPTTALSNPTVANPTAKPTKTATYTVTATNAGGCSSTSSVTITVNDVIAAMPTDYKSCGEDVKIGPASVPGYTYAWTPATGLSSTTVAQPTAAPSNLSYTLVVTNPANGCSFTIKTKLNYTPIPVLSLGSDVVACMNGCVTLAPISGTGFSSFAWSPADKVSKPKSMTTVACPTLGTMYTLTATTAAGCTATSQITVSISTAPAPTVSAGPDKLICAGASTTLTTTTNPDYVYEWQSNVNGVWQASPSVSNPNIANPTVSPTESTDYRILVTNGVTGCSSMDTVKITPQSLSVSLPGVVNICASSELPAVYTITLNNTPAISATNLAFVWSPTTGVSNSQIMQPSIDPDSDQSYTVNVTDPVTGCTATANMDVIVDQTLKPVLTDFPSKYYVCSATDSVTITLPVQAGVSYTLKADNPATTSTALVLSAKRVFGLNEKFSITATSAGLCGGSATMIYTVNQLIQPSVSQRPAALCAGSTTPVQIGSDSISANIYDYQWLVTTNMTNPSSLKPTVMPTASTNYLLRLTPKPDSVSVYGKGCVLTQSYPVALRSLPIADAGADQSFCSNGTLFIGTPAIPIYKYLWKAANDTISTVANPVIAPSQTTTYVLMVSDSLGCKSTDTVKVTVGRPNSSALNITPATCTAGAANNNGSIVLPATANFEKWSLSTLNAAAFDGPNYAGATTFAPNATIISTVPNTGGSYILRIFSGSDSCFLDTTLTVAAKLCCPTTATYSICPGKTQLLSADTGLADYQWFTVVGTVETPIVGAMSQTYVATMPGTYIWKSNGVVCNTCCPIIIEPSTNCCPSGCGTVTIQKL
jgi:hypothetical protein